MDDALVTDVREEYTPTPTEATYWFLIAVLLAGIAFPFTIPLLVS